MLLRFPKADAHAATVGATDPEQARLRSLQILAIDDKPAIVALTARMLNALGHAVETEHSAEAGLCALAAHPYDVVISDVGLGEGMNGWQFVDQIRLHWPTLPVVLATGWGAAIGEHETARIAPCVVVPKPFRLDDLRRALRQVMQS